MYHLSIKEKNFQLSYYYILFLIIINYQKLFYFEKIFYLKKISFKTSF